MKLPYLFLTFLAFQLSSIAVADISIVNGLLQSYQAQGASKPDAARGQKLWITEFRAQGEFAQRSCSSCHGKDLTQAGKHVKTGKTIPAMAPTINTERLTETGKIEKWFKRNCKWTFGRECSVQEKSDFLLYLSNPVIF